MLKRQGGTISVVGNIFPKCRFNAQLIHGLYHHTDIMTQDFTVEFVDNARVRFVADMLIKF